MLANNETGVIQPIRDVVEIAAGRGIRVHVDAVQAAGRIPIDLVGLGVDFLTLSAHKLGGPQGVGALIVRDGVPPPALIKGGAQEARLRAGTENVAGIAGFGLAAELAAADLSFADRIGALRDRMEAEILALSPDTEIFGAGALRLANTSCLTMPGVGNETQLIAFDLAGIAVSSGSACSSGKVGPSHVLAAIGVPEDRARTAIRVSFGWASAKSDADRFTAVYDDVLQRSRARRTAGQPARSTAGSG
jgi:cysteine desulfurase